MLALSSSTVRAQNFPHYVELDVGETVEVDGFPPVTLLETQVTHFDSVAQRVGAAEAVVQVGDARVRVPVGYEHADVETGGVRLGIEVIADYEAEQPSRRFHLSKEARLRIARAGEPLCRQAATSTLCSPLGTAVRVRRAD